LRLYFLTVNRRRIAFHYSLCYRNKLYLLKQGYDPNYAPYSPSNLLCEKVLRDAFERGVTEYDFLGAEADWKLEWTRETRPHHWLFVFPNRPRTRFLYWTKTVPSDS
jgi:CelD/BcsL family acetyltransferase involved in cellulose biosynthesis